MAKIKVQPLPPKFLAIFLSKEDRLRIDNFGFKLVTSYTFGLLCFLAAVAMIAAEWPSPIVCMLTGSADKQWNSMDLLRMHAVATYCFISGSFTLHDRNVTHGPGSEYMAQQGIRQPLPGDEFRFHNYYIWAPYILVLHAIIFRFPRELWKNLEGGLLSKLLEYKVGSLILRDNTLNTPDSDEWRNFMTRFATVLLDYRQYGLNRRYANMFLVCEVLNLLGILTTMWLTDMFLGGEFRTYTVDVLQHVLSDNPFERLDPLNLVFPKAIKCTFRLFGPTGNVQERDVFCVIGVNLFYEKMFVLLWAWYLLLLFVSCFVAGYRAVVISSPGVRAAILKNRMWPKDRIYLDTILNGPAGAGLGYADWFILKRISDNVNGKRFGEICWYMHKELEAPTRNKKMEEDRNRDGDGDQKEEDGEGDKEIGLALAIAGSSKQLKTPDAASRMKTNEGGRRVRAQARGGKEEDVGVAEVDVNIEKELLVLVPAISY